VNITAPFGYGEIVPLLKEHRVLLPDGNTPAFCRKLNALAVSVGEFVAAGRDYPVVFVRAGDEGYAPVVILGLAEGSNLYVDASGEWDRGVYFPAYVRRFPFCISKVYVDGEARGDRLVCVAKDYLDDAGVALFANGAPTPRWQAAERLLSSFEADLDRTAALCAAFARLELFEPFNLQYHDRPDIRLGGMFRVAEAKLKALRPAGLKALLDKGFLGTAFAHLHSLENFSRLAARLPAAGRG
jgi:hypothetical protein